MKKVHHTKQKTCQGSQKSGPGRPTNDDHAERGYLPSNSEHDSVSRRKFLGTTGKVVMSAGVLGAAGKFGPILAASEPYKIGVLAPLTGNWSIWGTTMFRGMELAAVEINEQGGILGRPVELIQEDNQSNPQIGVQKARKLILQDKVDMVAGTISSSMRDAVTPTVTQQGKTLFYYPTFYEGGICDKHLFVTGATPEQQVYPLADWILENIGKGFYLVGSDYVWPRRTNFLLKKYLEEKGGEVLGEEYVPIGTSDFSSILTRIKSAKPDAVLLSVPGNDGVSFAKQYHGFGLRDMTKLTTISIEESGVNGIGREAAKGIVSSFSYFVAIDSPANNQFIKRFRQEYGDDAFINNLTEAMYFSTYFVARGAESAGSLQKEALIKGMEGQSFEAPQGKVWMRPGDHQTKLNGYIAEVNDEGELEVIKHFPPLLGQDYCKQDWGVGVDRSLFE